MASFSFQLRDTNDLCHFILASEKDYGAQCLFLSETSSTKDYTVHFVKILRQLNDGRAQPIKDVAFLHVVPPGQSFNSYDNEKCKLALTTKAYFRMMDFFKSELPLVIKRMDADCLAMKQKNDWIKIFPDISFRGIADCVYKLPLDTTNTFVLDLVVFRRGDSGKTNISLNYSDEKLGSVNLPPATMTNLANGVNNLTHLYNYKEPSPPKKTRQL